jgi:hypothetical protein
MTRRPKAVRVRERIRRRKPWSLETVRSRHEEDWLTVSEVTDGETVVHGRRLRRAYDTHDSQFT